MATAFTTEGVWTGVIEGGFETARSVEGMPALAADYIYRREVYTVRRYRYGVHLLTFFPLENKTVTGDQLSVTTGTNTITGKESYTYLCLRDTVTPDPFGTTIWKQEQEWQGMTDWVAWQNPNAS